MLKITRNNIRGLDMEFFCLVGNCNVVVVVVFCLYLINVGDSFLGDYDIVDSL